LRKENIVLNLNLLNFINRIETWSGYFKEDYHR
jgi:hypothetical protein